MEEVILNAILPLSGHIGLQMGLIKVDTGKSSGGGINTHLRTSIASEITVFFLIADLIAIICHSKTRVDF